jgi:small basic protein
MDAKNMTEIIYLLVNLAGKGTDLSPYFGGYKDVYAFALIFVESLSEVAWIAGDLIIALISILLRRYYEALNRQLRSQQCGIISLRQLEEIRRVQLAISTLVQKIAEVFSPLILITIGCNVVYILTFLYSGLEADITSPSFFVRFVFTYSFIYIALRLTFSVYLASLLNEMVKLFANI